MLLQDPRRVCAAYRHRSAEDLGVLHPCPVRLRRVRLGVYLHSERLRRCADPVKHLLRCIAQPLPAVFIDPLKKLQAASFGDLFIRLSRWRWLLTAGYWLLADC